MRTNVSPTVLVLGLPPRPQAVLQEILQTAGLEVRSTTRPVQALIEQQQAVEPAQLLLIDEGVLDELGPLLPAPFEAAPADWPSTVVLSTTLDGPVERLAPSFARLGKPVEPALLLRELHIGLPADAHAPRFDIWHGGLVLLAGEGLSEDAAWYEALELAGFEATTARTLERACELCEQLRFDLVLTEAGGASPGIAKPLLQFRKSFGLPQPIAVLTDREEPAASTLRPELEALGAEIILDGDEPIERGLESIGDFLHRLDRARNE